MTPEVAGIIRYLERSGVPHRVTDIDTPGAHAPHSYHYLGLAVDFAGPTPSTNSPQLLAVFNAFLPVQVKLAELAYLGAPYNIKNGKRVPPYDKNNHVHVAVPMGTILAQEKPLMIPEDKKLIAAIPVGEGYALVSADGAVYCFGCDYKGGLKWENNQWVVR